MVEIWKEINDYEGLYQVSNLGRVKSLKKNDYCSRYRKEKILKPYKYKDGYYMVGLCKNGKQKNVLVHRLVAQTFIPNPNNKPCIDHINTDRTDNRVENLRWVTHKENCNNPITKEKKSSKNNYKSKPILQFSKDEELVRKWDCTIDIQRELGILVTSITNSLSGRSKSAGGFIWRYYYKGIWLKKHIPLKERVV